MMAISRLQKLSVLGLIMLLPRTLRAQPGLSEFYAVTTEVHKWYYGLSDMVMAIGAISGILGGLRVYANWQMGMHHVDKQVIGWLFACLFLVLTGTFLRALFGL